VRRAYGADPEREWRRLEGGAQARLEYLITRHVLQRVLPPSPPATAAPGASPRVLDAGGGPGRYTLDLARLGYRVTLLDLSPALLDFARRKIAAAPPDVQRRVEAIVEDSIVDLSLFPESHFDAVLCVGGPLSHILDPTARRRAVGELRRVAKPGAPLLIAVMNRLGAYRSAVQWPHAWGQVFPEVPATGVSVLQSGAPAYLFRPEEFTALLTGAGLTIQRLVGCSGIGAHLQEDHLLALMDDPERWPAWQAVLLDTCDHPNVAGVSNLLLAVTHRKEIQLDDDGA
jgi:SAM-dependent methyltransferase